MNKIILLLLCYVLFSNVALAENDEAIKAYAKGDYKTAFAKYYKLAKEGSADAQGSLAVMYQDGKGVPQSYTEAVKWYRKSAEQGDASSQQSLGAMYEDGRGVEKSYIYAHMWYNLAATNNRDLHMYRDALEMEMTSNQIQRAQYLATEWSAKHIKTK